MNRHVVAILAMVAVLFCFAAEVPAVWLWETESLADEGLTCGYDNSIALDANGHPHISTMGLGRLLYMTDITGVWTQEQIDTTTGPTSIDIATSGTVHIVYNGSYQGSSGILHASNGSGEWSIEPIETGAAFSYMSICLDETGVAHVAYYNASADILRYATNASGTWVATDVDTDGDVGQYASLALDNTGKAHISYYHEFDGLEYEDGELKYATNASGSWVTSVVDTTTHTGRFTGIACDTSGKAHISYYERASGSLHYATNASGSWVTELVDTDGTVGGYTSIAVDANDKAHISYYRYTFGTYSYQDLRYATNKSGSWDVHAFGYTGNDGRYTDIAIDGEGLAHIVCNGSNTKGLAYLTQQAGGSSWNLQIPDREGLDEGAGRSISLALDEANLPHIAYGTDYYARTLDVTSQTVRKNFLTSSGNAGAYVDIAALSSGTVYVNYKESMSEDVFVSDNTSGTWVHTTIAGTGTNPSMDLGTTGALHVLSSYSDWGVYYLRYSSNVTGAWAHTSVYLGANYIYRPVGATDIVSDTSNTIHAAYINQQGNLQYLSNRTGSPSVSTIVATGSTYDNDDHYKCMASIALDAGGNPRIAFHDKAAGKLKYAVLNDGTWTSQTIDSAGSPGACLSLAFDNADRPRIAYYAEGTGDLRLAYLDGAEWTTSTVVSEGDVGWMPSLRFDTNNMACVAYRNTTDLTIDYAVGYFRDGPYPPVVTSAAELTTNTTPTWSWASGGSGNGTFRYKMDDSDLGSGATETTAMEYTAPSPLSEGAHTLYVQERDTNANWSLSGSYEVTVDSIPPNAPAVTGPASPTTNTQPQWTWTSGGGGGNDTYHVSLDDATFSGSLPTYHGNSYTPSPLSDGTHTLYVRELDDAGNWSAAGSASVVIQSDAQTPTPTPTPVQTPGLTPTPQTWFQTDQQIAIESDGGVYALAFNYTTSVIQDSVNTSGNTSLSIQLAQGQWIGIFVYDYGTGVYTVGQYIYPSTP